MTKTCGTLIVQTFLADLFRSAAEAGPHDILKLYSPKGSIINISTRLEPNSPSSCYRLEVVATDCSHEPPGAEFAGGLDLSSIEKRLQCLERNILIYDDKTPSVVFEMKKQVDSFREKLENVEHLSWLGLFKDLSEGTHKPSPFYHKRTLQKTREECERVREKFLQMSSLEVSEESFFKLIFQINARTDLALRYNDISPLENHHCAVAFEILERSNIFRNLSTDQYKRIREGMIKCILATDMTRHNEILNKFKSTLPSFDFTNKEHKDLLMMILIKVSDISNEARPMEVAEPWLDCLLQEFFNQSDVEKLEGLPVTPFMDRDKVTKPSSQIGFIRFVLLPLLIELTKLFPCLKHHIIEPVRKALDYYTEMEKALEKEQQAWAQSENVAKSNEEDDGQDNPNSNLDRQVSAVVQSSFYHLRLKAKLSHVFLLLLWSK
uniref:Si:dkey-219c10.4 n=1 Tax=Oryzias sinensis TaxID=183150 RepID=A0A8C7XTC1_9TELE